MLGACAELASRLDLAAFPDVPAKPTKVLVVHVGDVIDAELADLATRREAATATAGTTTAGSTTGPTWATAAISATISTTFAALTLRSTEARALRALAALFCWTCFLGITHVVLLACSFA